MKATKYLVFLALLACGSARADWLWSRTVVGGTGAIRTIIYGNGTFVAGTNTGFTLSSRDAVNWTASRPTTLAINNIIYGNGRFVACVASGTGSKGKILYSADGVTWSFARRVANNGPFSSQSSLTVLGTKSSRFIGMGPAATAFATSTTGTRWQDPILGRKPAKYAGSISGLATNSSYILCSTLAGATIQTSPDGLAWATRFMTASRGPARGIASEKPGRRVICIGENGLCLVSNNAAATWVSHPFGNTDLLGIAFANRVFVSFADKMVYSTPGGVTWTRQLRVARGGDHLRAITGGIGLYVAAGSNGKNSLIMVSSGQPAPPAPP